VQWLLEHPSAALWWEMGLGKTLTVLQALSTLWALHEIRRVLVVAPKRVAINTWPAEVAKWMPHLTCSVITGTKKQRAAVMADDSVIHVTNYEQLPNLVEYWVGRKRWPYDVVVADEADNLKSFRLRGGSVRAQALARTLKKVDRFIELTGSPASEGLIHLWGQVFFLDRGERLGRTFTAFRDRWFRPAYGGRNNHMVYKWEAMPHSEKEILRRLEDVCLAMRTEDYLTMPPLKVVDVPVYVPNMGEYKRLHEEWYLELREGDVVADNPASKTGKLLQYTSGALYHSAEEGGSTGTWERVHDARLEAMDDILSEAGGQPVLVAYNFRHELERLQKRYPYAQTLGKGTEVVEAWNKGRVPMLLIHPKSGGHGLNLQAGGRVVVWFGLVWSLTLYEQLNARLYRQGQAKPTFVYRLIAPGTVDELVRERWETKKSVQDVLMNHLKECNR